MAEWQTRCGKRECRGDDRDPALCRDRGQGCERVRYQSMGIAGWGNRERPFSPTCADLQTEPSQGRLRGTGQRCCKQKRTPAEGRRAVLRELGIKRQIFATRFSALSPRRRSFRSPAWCLPLWQAPRATEATDACSSRKSRRRATQSAQSATAADRRLQAQVSGMTGDARKQFMSSCLSSGQTKNRTA
jgi:hypothetical protein